MDIIRKIFAVVVLVAIVSCANAVERPVYPCHRLAPAPVIDGELDDEAWKTIPEATGFFIFPESKNIYYAVEKQTFFKAGWTEDAIYLAIRAKENAPEKLIANGKDGEDLWMDDSIELFFFPTGTPDYTQLIASSAGSRWNGRGKNVADVMGWEAKTVVGKTEWVLELRIPFAVLAAKAPKEGDEWPVNVARNLLTGPAEERCTCWPPLRTGFHDVANFGRFVFKGKAGNNIAAEENELTRAYIQYMQGEIRQLDGLAGKYEKDLAEAQKSEKQCAEAENLLQAWAKVVTLAALADPGCRELMAARISNVNLTERSDDCVVKMMMERLFKE